MTAPARVRFAFSYYNREEQRHPELACFEIHSIARVREFYELASPGLVKSIARGPYAGISVADLDTREIVLSRGATWLAAVHEIAHLLEWRINSNGSHDHRFARRVRRLAKLCQAHRFPEADLVAHLEGTAPHL